LYRFSKFLTARAYPLATQRYLVTPHPIETLLTWVKSGEIAIPEIQRLTMESPPEGGFSGSV
jgi:hypothetical protein